MISNAHWLVLVHLSTLIVLMGAASAEVRGASDPEISAGQSDGSSKRAWNDVSGSWGKRGWNDLEGAWGKRAWERLTGAWGKRLTVNPDESFEDGPNKEINKRPEWGKLKGSWGKRIPDGERGWGNLKGLWGKRAWEKLGNSWGKRDEDLETPLKAPLETLHALSATSD